MIRRARAWLGGAGRWRRSGAERQPRVRVAMGGRQPRVLADDDAAAVALIVAAERLISASQRGSDT